MKRLSLVLFLVLTLATANLATAGLVLLGGGLALADQAGPVALGNLA